MTVFKLDPCEFDPMLIWGLICHDPDFRLCWKLNKSCRLSLARCEPEPGNPLVSSFYSFWRKDDQIVYNLIANKTDDGPLLPKYAHLDYFFTISAAHLDGHQLMLDTIRSVTNVLAVYELELEKASDQEKLILT